MYRGALGAAYGIVHFLARWSIEHASDDPAPHLFTAYWALEEALGLSERTLRRHLKRGQPWSEAISHWLDVKPCYSTMCRWDEGNRHRQSPRFATHVGLVIRFFPCTRLSPQATVKRWGQRDLIADADQGLTRSSRPV